MTQIPVVFHGIENINEYLGIPQKLRDWISQYGEGGLMVYWKTIDRLEMKYEMSIRNMKLINNNEIDDYK